MYVRFGRRLPETYWRKPARRRVPTSYLMQCNSEKYPVSFVVTDPKGSIVNECGKMLLHYGYQVKILNTINFTKSMHYNPFEYIHSEKDILKLVTALIANTKGEGKGGDDFWISATRSPAVKSWRTRGITPCCELIV